MPTQTRIPTSEVSVTGTWSGANRHLLLDDFPDSGNPITDGTTCSANGVLVLGFTAFSIPADATAISVQVRYYDFKNGTGSSANGALIRCNDTTNRLAGSHNPGNGNANIALRDVNYATNPKSGANWTVDDVNGIGTNGLTAFGISSTDSNPTNTISCIQLQVTYTRNVTLTAGGGTLSLGGQTAGTKAGRKVSANSGGVTLSGQVVGLRQAKKLQVDYGNVSISGQDAGLGKGFKLIAGFGNLSVTGQDATLTKSATGYTLPAGYGNIAIAGQSVNLLKGFKLSAEAGSLNLSGQNSNLLKGFRLPAGTGALGLGGQTARVKTGRKIVTGHGQLSVTGYDANLVYVNGYILQAQTGILNISAGNTHLIKSYFVYRWTGAEWVQINFLTV